MPGREVVVRRWMLVAVFLALTASYVIGLWAFKRVYEADRRGRKERLAEIHRQEVKSCQSRHNLAVALLYENSALAQAQATAIREARQLKHFPGLTDRQLRDAKRNADKLLRKLRKAHMLSREADCRQPPKPLAP